MSDGVKFGGASQLSCSVNLSGTHEAARLTAKGL